MITTDQTARLKMLAAMALAEAEDGRSDPDAVIPYLDKISTADLEKILAATKYCIIELHIVKELGTREDMTAKRLMELTTKTEHAAVKKALCEAATKLQVARKLPLTMEEFNALSASGVTGSAKEAIEYTLQNAPKGVLSNFLSQTFESTQYLVINEFKRRNDPIGERLLDLLDMKLSKSTREEVTTMIRRDPRITPKHLLAVTNSETVNQIFYEKIKNAPVTDKLAWYREAGESFRSAIIVSLEKDFGPEVEASIDTLIERSRSSAIHAMIIRILGKHLPIEQLLSLRDRTTDKMVTDAFAEVFGVRYKELQKFLAS